MLSMGQGLYCGMVVRPDLLDCCVSTPQRTKEEEGKKRNSDQWLALFVCLSVLCRS